MGVVYRARHRELKRTVALKVMIAGEDASTEAIQRFHREAEAVAKLGHHPHIVPVYEFGQEGNRHFFALHYVEGQSLDRKIKAGEITPRRAATIAKKVALALHHAHENGVLHRDVKPQNILLTQAGEPQVTDFGLARVVESEAQVTRSGFTLGTPQYMPPEQAAGDHPHIDARSDVYSLGAALYEMATGQPPFQGATTLHVLKKVLFDEPVPPRRLNPAIGRDLETICLKALEKGRRKRYATAREMGEDLERYLKGEPIHARPRGFAESMVRRARRHKMTSAVVLFLVLAAAAVAAWGVFESVKPGRLLLKIHAPGEPAFAIDGKEVTAARSPEGEGVWSLGPLKLAPGEHRFTATLEGFEPFLREFRVQAGSTLELDLKMERCTGFVTILSDPENCELLLSGEEGDRILMTPLNRHPLPTGSYRVSVRKKNHFEAKFPLEIRRGETQFPRKIHLERIHGWSCPLPGSPQGYGGECRVMDVDGDGADDLFVFWRNSALTCISGMWGRVLWSRNGTWARGQWTIGDFNGDGRTEILLLERGGDGKSNIVCLAGSTGRERWRLPLEISVARDWYDRRGPFLADKPMQFDGDGADDFLCQVGGRLIAYSGRTRKPLWDMESREGGFPISGAPGAGMIFLLGYASVTAVDPGKGEILWTAKLPASISENGFLSPGDVDGDAVPDLIGWGENKLFLLSGGEKEVIWEVKLGPEESWDFFESRWGFWRSSRRRFDFDAQVQVTVKVVPDRDGDGSRDVLVHNRAHKNILTCLSGSSGTKIWDSVLPGPVQAVGECVDTDGDGTFELPVSLGGNRLALLEEGRGESVKWMRKGMSLIVWHGTVVGDPLDVPPRSPRGSFSVPPARTGGRGGPSRTRSDRRGFRGVGAHQRTRGGDGPRHHPPAPPGQRDRLGRRCRRGRHSRLRQIRR
jgi:hypothetical protein